MDVAAVVPASTLGGFTELSTGVGFTTFSVTEFDAPPPGGVKFGAGGFNTAIATWPTVDTSDGNRATVNCVLEMKFVVRFAPSTVTIDTLLGTPRVGGTPTKFDPLIVIVTPCDPAAIVVGAIDEICGTGNAVGVTANDTIFEVPPPGGGVVTKISIVPAARTSPGFTITVNFVSERKIVARGKPLKVTIELGANPDPFTVSVKAADPAGVLAGLTVETFGLGRLTTPPQDANSSMPAANPTAESFERKLKSVFFS